MTQRILVTGSTDGIGFEAAKKLAKLGHQVLIHGRSHEKLYKAKQTIENELKAAGIDTEIEAFEADLSDFDEISKLIENIKQKYSSLDVLINNAGVFKTSDPITKEGFDVRFVVNTIAPYWITKELLPLMSNSGRIINLSSAAQAPIDHSALAGDTHLSDDFLAYAQSKLALTMWTFVLHNEGIAPTIIALNPGSLLATKMVKEGFGLGGNDIDIGTDVIVRTAVDDAFQGISGKYFDNDSGDFSDPHEDALDAKKCRNVVETLERVLEQMCAKY